MEINLENIGMEQGRQYETIITTCDANGIKNAAAIGCICSGRDTVLHRIFKGSKTLDNIITQKTYTVNVNKNPLLFTLATVDNIPSSYFTLDNSIKNSDAYFKCEVVDLKSAVKKSDPIRKSEAVLVKSKVVKLVINKEIKAENRAFEMIIESLVNYTRLDLVDDEQKKYYLNRFMEAIRVVNKVGSKKEQQAMKEIKNALKRKLNK